MSNAELERLAILVEECAEVQQIAMKIIRHGYESYNPFDENKISNRKLLEKELGDLIFAYRLLLGSNDIDYGEIEKSIGNKSRSIQQYLHFQTEAKKNL